MKRLVYLLSAGVVMLAAGCSQEQTDAIKLKAMVKEINHRSPMDIDEYTRLDSAAVNEPLGLTYYYTLPTTDKDSIAFDVQEVKGKLTQQAQRGIDTIKVFRTFSKPIGVKYVYNDKSGRHVFDYTVKTKHK